MINKWHTASTKTVFEHPRMTLDIDVVELPDGETMEYLRMAPAQKHSVAVIALNGLGEVLVQREYSHPTGEVLLQLPGGSIEPHEPVAEAANRELSAESGLVADRTEEVGWFFTTNRLSNQRQYVVVCTDLREEQCPPDPGEFIESTWMTPEAIDEAIGRGEVVNINMLAALKLYEQSQKPKAS